MNSLLQSFAVQWILNELVTIPKACGEASAAQLDKLTFLNHFLCAEVAFVVFWTQVVLDL